MCDKESEEVVFNALVNAILSLSHRALNYQNRTPPETFYASKICFASTPDQGAIGGLDIFPFSEFHRLDGKK
jgi:hypothetical protein